MKASGKRVVFRAEVATVGNFGALLASGCRVLHYTGHGLESGDLAFENEQVSVCATRCSETLRSLVQNEWAFGQGELHPLRAENLRELLVGRRAGTELAFVSACHSQEAGQAFVAAGVPSVVAIKLDSKVLDKQAMHFSRVFYEALLSGKTVKEAFDNAERNVRAAR